MDIVKHGGSKISTTAGEAFPSAEGRRTGAWLVGILGIPPQQMAWHGTMELSDRGESRRAEEL